MPPDNASAPRREVISANWKMNLTHLDAIQWMQKLWFLLPKGYDDRVDVTVHPPFTALRSAQTVIESDKMALLLGAQNCWHEDKGAFTGEVSAPMLAKLQVHYVIVGHSERRALFGDTDELVAKKARSVIGSGMTPIVCVGESLEQREAGDATTVVEAQLKGSLSGVDPAAIASLVIAYEPVWAIGTGRTAEASDAQDMAATIRSWVSTTHGSEAGGGVRIQYGGSVKPAFVPELMSQPDVDGLLEGGASLDPEEFGRIVMERD